MKNPWPDSLQTLSHQWMPKTLPVFMQTTVVLIQQSRILIIVTWLSDLCTCIKVWNGIAIEAIVTKWPVQTASWDFKVVKEWWGGALLSVKCCCFVWKPSWKILDFAGYHKIYRPLTSFPSQRACLAYIIMYLCEQWGSGPSPFLPLIRQMTLTDPHACNASAFCIHTPCKTNLSSEPCDDFHNHSYSYRF